VLFPDRQRESLSSSYTGTGSGRPASAEWSPVLHDLLTVWIWTTGQDGEVVQSFLADARHKLPERNRLYASTLAGAPQFGLRRETGAAFVLPQSSSPAFLLPLNPSDKLSRESPDSAAIELDRPASSPPRGSTCWCIYTTSPLRCYSTPSERLGVSGPDFYETPVIGSPAGVYAALRRSSFPTLISATSPPPT
jgi:hypothetical protein